MRVGRRSVFFCFCFSIFVALASAQESVPGKQGTQTDANSTASAKAATGTLTPQNPVDDRYRIGYQDTLDIQVFRHPELNKRVSVDANGTITLFRLDAPIVAVCKTESELAGDIAKAYEKDYLRNPEVSV